MHDDIIWIWVLYTIGKNILDNYEIKGLCVEGINPVFYGYWIMSNINLDNL